MTPEARLADNFKALQPPITMDDCWRQLSDVAQGGGAADEETCDGVATCATVVLCPARRSLYVCCGGPSADNRQALTL